MPQIILALVLLVSLAAPVGAATYYVSPAGNDTAACQPDAAGASARKSLTGGLACLRSGDQLVVQAGTYSEAPIRSIPSGGGTETTRTVVRCETPLACAVTGQIRLVNRTTHWITIEGFRFTSPGGVTLALNTTDTVFPSTNFPHHIRLSNFDVAGSPLYCLYTGHGEAIELINVTVHGCKEQGVYWLARNSSWIGGELYDIRTSGQQGITMHTSGGMRPSGNRIEGIFFHDIVGSAIEFANTEWNVVTRNIFARIGFSAVRAGANVGAVSHTDIDHNTIVGGSFGVNLEHPASTGNRLRNNLILGASIPLRFCAGCGTPAGNVLTGTPAEHFVAPLQDDYRLLATSSAVDAGIDLGRPFTGLAPDAGVFELAPAPPPPDPVPSPPAPPVPVPPPSRFGITERTERSIVITGTRADCPGGITNSSKTTKDAADNWLDKTVTVTCVP